MVQHREQERWPSLDELFCKTSLQHLKPCSVYRGEILNIYQTKPCETTMAGEGGEGEIKYPCNYFRSSQPQYQLGTVRLHVLY
jgi:hypothetical protein